MTIEIACIISGTMVFTGFIVGGGIIMSGLVKVAKAIENKKD